jgi:hypothetical protein
MSQPLCGIVLIMTEISVQGPGVVPAPELAEVLPESPTTAECLIFCREILMANAWQATY